MWIWKVLGIILYLLAAFFILAGIGTMMLFPSQDFTMSAMSFFITGALFITLGIKAFRKGSANSEGVIRKWAVLKAISLIIGIPSVFIGYVSMQFSPYPDSTINGNVIFGIGAFFIILGIIAHKKDLAVGEGLTLLAEGGLISPRYFIGNEGIYKENKLFLRWSEIFDVFVIREYEESHFISSGRWNIYKMGAIRVITKNGFAIDIVNVINPKEIVEYIKNIYLRNMP